MSLFIDTESRTNVIFASFGASTITCPFVIVPENIYVPSSLMVTDSLFSFIVLLVFLNVSVVTSRNELKANAFG